MEELPPYFNDVMIFLLAAVVVVSTFRWLKASPVIGYLIAGVLIGPYFLGFISDIDTAKFLGELGVVFLLFSIGLKLTLDRLQSMKRYVFGLGTVQILTCSLAIGFICYALGVSIEASVLIGSALALSSTAVGLQILTERDLLATRFGRVSFSVLLMQDLAVVVLLVLVSTIGQEQAPLIDELGWVAVKTGFVLALIIAVGRIILRPVYRAIATLGNPELFIAMTLLVVFTTSLATAAAGLSMELGAFLAGLLLAETEYRHQVQADIAPFHGLLLGLFFMTVGMSIDLNLIFDHIVLLPVVILGLLLTKLSLIMLVCRAFFLPWITALRIGLLLASGGEFAFVIFMQAIQHGQLTSDMSQLLYAAVAISMGLAPLLDALGSRIEDFYTGEESKATIKEAMSEIGDLRDHVILLGFGRVGQLVGKMLSERVIPFVAIDNDMDQVNFGRAKGWPVFYGDAKRQDVLETIGGKKARVVVISIDSSLNSMRAAVMIRKNYPNVDVCVRMRDDRYLRKLLSVGVTVIMPENLEPSLQLASSVLNSMGIPEEENKQVIDNFRKVLSMNDPQEEDVAQAG